MLSDAIAVLGPRRPGGKAFFDLFFDDTSSGYQVAFDDYRRVSDEMLPWCGSASGAGCSPVTEWSRSRRRWSSGAETLDSVTATPAKAHTTESKAWTRPAE